MIATKQLLETLTQWSRHTATEGEVSDVYVRLGYEFNIACRAFTQIGVETSDLGPVPDLLRGILEDTLSQEASPASLDKFLPRIRDIIINLLHGLKRKQQRLRSRQAKENPGSILPAQRQMSTGSAGSGETGITQMLDEVPNHRATSTRYNGNGSIGSSLSQEDPGVPPRVSSVQTSTTAFEAQKQMQTGESSRGAASREVERSAPLSPSSSISSQTMQNLPVLQPEGNVAPISRTSTSLRDSIKSYPAPPPPPKQQDALAALQRGGELERRASRRYSAYQISKHLGASPSGVPMLPPAQNSPIPNRGRDLRESMNAVRVRGSAGQTRQRSANRYESSPNRTGAIPQRISEEGSQTSQVSTKKGTINAQTLDGSTRKVPEESNEPIRSAFNETDAPRLSATLNGPPTDDVEGIPLYDSNDPMSEEPEAITKSRPSVSQNARGLTVDDGYQSRQVPPEPSEEFTPETSPQPGKELTLFLQYKSKIKKVVLPGGPDDLTLARLQLHFIEKFAWNTHSNGIDLPDIYIQDPVSGVRHELEDLADVKDRAVLVLNVEVLDEVKRHIDEGLGGVRKMIEGVRMVMDAQQSTIQRVSERQEDTTKEIAALASAPSKAITRSGVQVNGIQPSLGTPSQIESVQSLRRDLAVVRQSFSAFTSDMKTSMATVRTKVSNVKATAIIAAVPKLEGESGRLYVNAGKKTQGEESEIIVNRVDDLQDIVEDLRKDVVTRGVRPLPRQLETVSKDISMATNELKKLQDFLRKEKPIWTKIWEQELEDVCVDRDFLTMQEELIVDLEDDLSKATQTFALVEQATKQQNLQQSNQTGGIPAVRAASRGLNAIAMDQDIDPMKAKDGVLGEVRALQPNHETRLEAIERAERARQKELENRREGEFKRELGNFVEQGKLKKSGGVEEAERLRTAKDERNRRGAWEQQQARAAGKGREQESATAVDNTEAAAEIDGHQAPIEGHNPNGAESAEEEQPREIEAPSAEAGEQQHS